MLSIAGFFHIFAFIVLRVYYIFSSTAMELLLLLSPSRTLLESRSNQRIRPKTDSRVPKCVVLLTLSNRVRG